MITINSYQLNNGEKRYMFRTYVGINELTGKPMNTTRRGFRSIKEAEMAYFRLKNEIYENKFKQTKPQTYQELYELWVTGYKKKVEASTFDKTTRLFKNHILPAMKDYKVDKITPFICEHHIDVWAQKLVNFRSVASYASRVMEHAIKLGSLQKNPFDLVEYSKKRAIAKNATLEKKKFFEKSELTNLLNKLEQDGNLKIYAFFRLLAYSGCRKGEALALKWNDIDFENNQIAFIKAIGFSREVGKYEKQTKTGQARKIKMDPLTMSILRDWQLEQRQQLKIMGFKTNSTTQLVFQNKFNKWIYSTKTRDWLIKALNECNISSDLTTHSLRHTHASICYAAGISPKLIQQRLGHIDTKTTTKYYIHTTAADNDMAIDKFADYLT